MFVNFARRAWRKCLPVAVALALVMLPTAAAWACPGCKDALAANDPERARAARGYFWSIIFMFSMPYAILGTVGGYFYWEVRRARNNKDALAKRQSEEKAAAEASSNADSPAAGK